jgi:hypothetical protein
VAKADQLVNSVNSATGCNGMPHRLQHGGANSSITDTEGSTALVLDQLVASGWEVILPEPRFPLCWLAERIGDLSLIDIGAERVGHNSFVPSENSVLLQVRRARPIGDRSGVPTASSRRRCTTKAHLATRREDLARWRGRRRVYPAPSVLILL